MKSIDSIDEGPSGDWQPLMGAHGLWFRSIGGHLDETASRGFRTRFVRFDPGGHTREPYRHAYWEEVYLLTGDIIETGAARAVHKVPSYVIRPPGTAHGPFTSERGCLLLEIHYFDSASRSLER